MDGNKPWVSWSLPTKIVVSIAGVLATVLVLVLNFA